MQEAQRVFLFDYIVISRYRKQTEFLKLTVSNYGESTKFKNFKGVARLHH